MFTSTPKRLLTMTAGLAIALAATSASAQDVFKVTNASKKVRVLSDLIAFDGKDNTGKKTIVMKPKDKADDINIAAGKSKNIVVPKGSKSFTISWTDPDTGKEVEADTNFAGATLAFFQAPAFPGDIAVAFDDVGGTLPGEGFAGLVNNGKLADPAFSWMTFFDTTANNGFILRDGVGTPMSPLLSGMSVHCGFHYAISTIPTPGAVALLAPAGGLAMLRRRRR